MNEETIRAFWNAHPCGERHVRGLDGDYERFFCRFDAFRYRKAPHILRQLDQIDFRNKRVLEIGLGQGADGEQMIRRGAIWSGLDLTQESVARVRTRLSLRRLLFERVECGSVLSMPFASRSFDIVFSHGVLHHVPEIERAQQEIARVLKPGGMLVMMVYAKMSLNYLVSIALLRRLGLIALYFTRARVKGIYGTHVDNAEWMGLLNYLKMRNFLHYNTDGPLNPYSRVYSVKDVRRHFPDFDIVRSHKEFMHAPPLPVARLPGASLLGWHLWVHLSPRPRDDARAEAMSTR
jgi:SAM-dependent methyltransferase